MSHRFRVSKGVLTCAVAVVVAVALLIPASVAAQTQQSTAKGSAQAWTKKTPDGQPDLQGFWSTTTSAPLERNVNCGTKEFWTDEEVAKGIRTCAAPAAPAGAAAAAPAANGQRGARGQRGAAAAADDGAANVHYDTAQFGLNIRTSAVNNRTSLIVGPEGRIPALSAMGQSRQAELAQQRTNFDGPEKRPLTERCIVWSAQGPPMMSPGYNSNLQIVQGEGYVMIQPEMMQDARIIPLKPRGALSENVRLWGGDSQGHFEGDTLVVETANFNGRNPFQRVGSEKMKLTERFKRLDATTLLYEFTVDDPVWTKPWTVQVPWAKSEGPLFEYACHEGNYGMSNILSGARAAEKAAADAAKVK